MKLSRTQVLKYKVCISCIDDGDERDVDCDKCEYIAISHMKAVDLCETLEAAWAEMDEKELQHEKARRKVELQLEKAIKLFKSINKRLAENFIREISDNG
jgi:hypothetical protein